MDWLMAVDHARADVTYVHVVVQMRVGTGSGTS
jgi:hypothetical protein